MTTRRPMTAVDPLQEGTSSVRQVGSTIRMAAALLALALLPSCGGNDDSVVEEFSARLSDASTTTGSPTTSDAPTTTTGAPTTTAPPSGTESSGGPGDCPSSARLEELFFGFQPDWEFSNPYVTDVVPPMRLSCELVSSVPGGPPNPDLPRVNVFVRISDRSARPNEVFEHAGQPIYLTDSQWDPIIEAGGGSYAYAGFEELTYGNDQRICSVMISFHRMLSENQPDLQQVAKELAHEYCPQL